MAPDKLDHDVLISVIGWKLEGKDWVTPDGHNHPVSQTPKVSKDERLAFRLIDYLAGKYTGDFKLERYTLCAPCMRWEARFGSFVGRGESPAQAMCIAALEVTKSQ